MKFLKTRWYLWKSTGEGTGKVCDKVFDRACDAKLYRVNHPEKYHGWHIDKGAQMEFMTNFEQIRWEKI